MTVIISVCAVWFGELVAINKISNKCFILFQSVANGSPKDKDSPNSILKDIRDKQHEKENTDINIQNNQLNQTYDTISTSIKESSRTKKKDNSSRPFSNTVILNANIPKFYFPMGRPAEKDDSEEVLLRVSQEFSKFEGGKVYRQQMGVIAKVMNRFSQCCSSKDLKQ